MEKFYKIYNDNQGSIKKYLIGNNDYLYGTIIGNKKDGEKINLQWIIIHFYYIFLMKQEE